MTHLVHHQPVAKNSRANGRAGQQMEQGSSKGKGKGKGKGMGSILYSVQGHAAEQHEVHGLDAPRAGYGVVG